jgi:hypothetical protein
MRIFMKAVASTATVGLLAFGAVGGSGGTAFAAPNPYSLITGCTAAVGDGVAAGFVPNCAAIGGTIEYPNTSIYIEVDETEDALGSLIDDQVGQGFEASWNLVCDVNGTTVTAPGKYEITSTAQAPQTAIDLQTAVGSPDPNQCEVDDLTVQTVLPLNAADLDDALPFQIGVAAVAAVAVPGTIRQDEGTTGAGAGAKLCADDTANGNAGAKIQGFECLGDLAQPFVRTTTGQIVHNGDCVSVEIGGYVVLAPCVVNDTVQQWTQSKVGGTVKNQSTGTCLTAPSVKNGTPLTVEACGSAAHQQWDLPAASAGLSPRAVAALGAALFRK